ncbi:MAG: hypothetical protein ACOH18_01140 [Candidatus Saccharimonadaceae bacterium]
MHQISSTATEQFKITVTASLRELFAQTHAKTDSDPDAANKKFPTSEQFKLYLVCQAASNDDAVKFEDNLLELMEYLDEEGLPIAQISIGIRLYSPRTKGVAIRLAIARHRENQMQRKLELQKEREQASRGIRFQAQPRIGSNAATV